MKKSRMTLSRFSVFLGSFFFINIIFFPFIFPKTVEAQLSCNTQFTDVCDTGCVPLIDMQPGQTYGGQTGGLYGNYSNEVPAAHLQKAQAAMNQITPLNNSGNPAANGKIILLTLGMSNPHGKSNKFIEQAKSNSAVSDELLIVNGARGSVVADDWAKGVNWDWTKTQVTNAGGNVSQVQAIWMEHANFAPNPDQPQGCAECMLDLAGQKKGAYVNKLSSDLRQIHAQIKTHYPNVKLIFMSNRTYGGYAPVDQGLNDEPYAYENAYAVRQVILDQVNGVNNVPPSGTTSNPGHVMVWGPYLWADDNKPNGQGLSWHSSDFFHTVDRNGQTVVDCTHPSEQGYTKAGAWILNFFLTNSLAKPWFSDGTQPPPPPPTSTTNPTIGQPSITPSGNPVGVIAQCSAKRALKNGEQITQIQVGQEFTYELTLSPSNHTGASVSDPIPEGLSVIASSLPSYCSASGSVLGASVVRTSLSNTTILLMLITTVWIGGTVYLVIRYIRLKDTEEIKVGKKKISKKELKQILTIEMGVTILLLVIVVGVIVRDRRAAPEDSSAATGTMVVCNEVPPGTTKISFNVKAVSGSGSVTNRATIVSGGSSSTCEHSMTIIGLSTSVTPSNTVNPTETTIPSSTPTTIPSQTPSVTPTIGTTPGVTPTITIQPTTPVATNTPQPTQGAGVACGRADVNQDGKFTIVDFIAFASMYQRECNDANRNYQGCGHKDSDKNGKVEIHDFISFAGRYAPRESCAL